MYILDSIIIEKHDIQLLSNEWLLCLLQDDDLIGSIPLMEPHLKVRLVTDPKFPPHCFEIYSEDGVIKAWKKDSDGKPVPGV